MLSKVSFKESMKSASRYDVNFSWTDDNWDLFQKLYENNYLNAVNPGNLLIPKIIHQIWLGSEFPVKYAHFQESWVKNHPDWKYILWTDKDVGKIKLFNKKAFDKAKNYGTKSDILRYEILYQYGGLYVDTDFECVKPFDELHYLLEFYAGCHDYQQPQIPNGLIACIPKHRIIDQCIRNINTDILLATTESIFKDTGPDYFTKQFVECVNNESKSIVIFPSTFFYPLPNSFRTIEYNKRSEFSKLESYAIHHWEVSWVYLTKSSMYQKLKYLFKSKIYHKLINNINCYF